MFWVNGHPIDDDAGLVQLLDLAQREVARSFPEVVTTQPFPLRGSQLRVLSMVPLEGGRRLSHLATIADMTKQAMGEFVADLADRGYVTIRPDPGDRRAKLVSLTDEGRAAAEWARSALRLVDRRWADEMGEGDLATLKTLLARLAGVD
jgi:DNA-binding MarR family transcriptional regulator